MRSCAGRLCQYRYSSAFISSKLAYLRTVRSMRSICSTRPNRRANRGLFRTGYLKPDRSGRNLRHPTEKRQAARMQRDDIDAINIPIRIAQSHELSRALAAYHAWGYEGGIAPDDTTWTAEVAGELIAVARIAPDSGTLVLRG